MSSKYLYNKKNVYDYFKIFLCLPQKTTQKSLLWLCHYLFHLLVKPPRQALLHALQKDHTWSILPKKPYKGLSFLHFFIILQIYKLILRTLLFFNYEDLDEKKLEDGRLTKYFWAKFQHLEIVIGILIIISFTFSVLQVILFSFFSLD